MAKPDLGTKRLCGSCGAKFYDLSKSNIVCPKCGTVFEVVAVRPSRADAGAAARAAAATAAAAAAAAAAKPDIEPETQDAEFVSLEDAEAEQQGKKSAATGAEAVDDDVEIEDDGADDAPFIEEEEDGADDVTDIIGEREDDEET